MKPASPDMLDYDYPLPTDRIAFEPVEPRDASRLLVMKDGQISETHFRNVASVLPENSLLVWNNTRVIHARLVFYKPSGARIEVFCLEPLRPEREVQQALQAGSGTVWQCMIGNARKWKSGPVEMQITTSAGPCTLRAEKIAVHEGQYEVRFDWTLPGLCMAEVLEAAGKVPLPPYISREATEKDNRTYQTVYAVHDGSVAAPTAGLHFTPGVIRSLDRKNIRHANVTLHVGAGTFKPVTEQDLHRHIMHNEQIHLRRKELDLLIDADDKVVVVGTTSLRTLESFYWMGVQLAMGRAVQLPFILNQWDPYEGGLQQDVPASAAWQALRAYMDEHLLDEVTGETRLFIVPGYRIRTAATLITNFHQPRSTLLLLVSAFVGEDWHKAYDYALAMGFRFLSYGDACVFSRQPYDQP